MAQELVISPAGLYTDPSALEAPQGALSDARNVVINRQGLIEPRPGFPMTRPLTGDWYPNGLKAESGQIISFERDGVTPSWRAVRLASSTTVDTNPPPDAAATAHMMTAARQSLYWTSNVGIRKLPGGDAAAAVRAGIPNPFFYPEMVKSGTVGYPSHVYYQFCILRKDATGYEIRSAPSGLFLCATNLFVSPRSSTPFEFKLYICPPLLREGDVIECYRSIEVPVAEKPAPEVYAACLTTISAADLAAGYATLVDGCAEERLGAALYTCPSQLGAERSYDDPPLSWEVATFSGSTFYARTTNRRFALLTPTSFYANSSYAGTVAPGIGAVFRPFGIVAGSPVLTLASGDTDPITYGMTVSEDGQPPGVLGFAYPYIPKDARVVSKTSTTVTMDKNALATTPPGVAVGLVFGDVLTIGSTEYYFASRSWYDRRVIGLLDTGHPVGDQTWIVSSQLAFAINYWSVNNGLTLRASVLNGHDPIYDVSANDTDATVEWKSCNGLYIEDLSTTYTSDSLYCTNGHLMGPVPLPEPSATPNSLFESTVSKNQIRWSEADLPEAVPPAWGAQVGSAAANVLRMVPLRDCMLVFKEDGLWRISGNPPDGLVIDQVDPTLRLLRPEGVDVLEDLAYAITSRGIVAIGPDGVRATISDPIDVSIRYRLASATGGLWLACQDADKQVICGGVTSEDVAYVYSTKTNAWSYWDGLGALRCAAFSATSNVGTLYLGTSPFVVTASGVRTESRNYLDSDYADGTTVYTVTAVSPSATQDAVGGLWDLSVSPPITSGDVIVGSGVSLVVVAQITGGVMARVIDEGAVPATGSYTAYRSYTCSVKFTGKTVQNPGLLKTWRELSFGFSEATRLNSVRLSADADIDTSTSNSTLTLNPRATSASARQMRYGIAQAGLQAVTIYPRITWRQSLCKPLLSSLSLIFEPVSENVRVR